MRSWLFNLLFPRQRAMMFHAAKIVAEAEIGREFRKKMSTMFRSPLDESTWIRKFVTLDADYDALEKEVGELRLENLGLKQTVKILQGSGQ